MDTDRELEDLMMLREALLDALRDADGIRGVKDVSSELRMVGRAGVAR